MATRTGSSSRQLHRPGPVCPARPDQYDDDMNDQTDIERYACHIAEGDPKFEPLFQAIRIVQDRVYDAFTKYDVEAIKYHKLYQYLSVVAVVVGAMSVVFAVAEAIRLESPIGHIDAIKGELGTAVLTIFFIVFGLSVGYKERWILARFKAENLRLLKFRRLTDPRMWCEPGDLDAAAGDLGEEVEEITGRDYEGAKEWAAQGLCPKAAAPPCEDRCPEALHELVDYYIPKRLDVQIRYLKRHANVTERGGHWSALCVQLLFWGSFMFVLAHLSAAWIHPPTVAELQQSLVESGINHRPKLEDWLALFALILPVVAAAIRTHRAANEFERTTLRHKATLESLHTLSHKLRETKDLQEKFELIGFCELILEADCREFMRLVSEAEWYG